jgi:hypothetical protein
MNELTCLGARYPRILAHIFYDSVRISALSERLVLENNIEVIQAGFQLLRGLEKNSSKT